MLEFYNRYVCRVVPNPDYVQRTFAKLAQHPEVYHTMSGLSVIVHFMILRKSGRWIRHLAVPAIGFVVIGYVPINAERTAKIAGLGWLAAGSLVLLCLRARGASKSNSAIS